MVVNITSFFYFKKIRLGILGELSAYQMIYINDKLSFLTFFFFLNVRMSPAALMIGASRIYTGCFISKKKVRIVINNQS